MFCTSCQMYKSAWKHRLILPPTGCLKIHFDFRYVFSFPLHLAKKVYFPYLCVAANFYCLQHVSISPWILFAQTFLPFLLSIILAGLLLLKTSLGSLWSPLSPARGNGRPTCFAGDIPDCVDWILCLRLEAESRLAWTVWGCRGCGICARLFVRPQSYAGVYNWFSLFPLRRLRDILCKTKPLYEL